MIDPILSRTQRNDIFQQLTRVKLDPADFQWLTRPVTPSNQAMEILIHSPTKAQLEFSRSNGGFWVVWWPSLSGGKQGHIAKSWEQAREFSFDWLRAAAADHAAPDLWAEISKGKAIPGATERDAEYQKEFSPAELKQLESALPEIERYITTTQPLDDDQKKQVHQRFVYLLDAAKRGMRKIDWLNIFVGQVVGMVTGHLLDPSVYSTVMAHAATVLNAVFQFGVRLLN